MKFHCKSLYFCHCGIWPLIITRPLPQQLSPTVLIVLAGIFQDLEDLYDFQTISYGGHFVFQNEAKILQRQVFIAINIPCKFGEDIFINE